MTLNAPDTDDGYHKLTVTFKSQVCVCVTTVTHWCSPCIGFYLLLQYKSNDWLKAITDPVGKYLYGYDVVR